MLLNQKYLNTCTHNHYTLPQLTPVTCQNKLCFHRNSVSIHVGVHVRRQGVQVANITLLNVTMTTRDISQLPRRDDEADLEQEHVRKHRARGGRVLGHHTSSAGGRAW